MTDIMMHPPPRRTLLAIACMLIGLGSVLLALTHFVALPAMRDYLGAAIDRQDAISRFSVIMGWLSVICIAISAYSLSLGIRVLRQGRWPLEGAWVFRITPVQRGAMARIRGAVLIFSGLLAVACAVLALTIPSSLAAA